MKTKTVPLPPRAAKHPHRYTLHGAERNDEFAWLRLSEKQRQARVPDEQTLRVTAYLQEENTYTEGVLAPVADLRHTLFNEMKGRVKESDLSVPYRENGYWYQYRFEAGAEYPVHMRAPVLAEKDRVPERFEDFLDENAMAADHDYFDLADFEIAPGNQLMAYSIDTVGRRRFEIRFRDLSTGQDLPDVITHAGDGGAFADDRTFFYIRKDRSLRNARVFRHIMGTDPAMDVELFHEKNRAFSCEVYRSRSDRYVI